MRALNAVLLVSVIALFHSLGCERKPVPTLPPAPVEFFIAVQPSRPDPGLNIQTVREEFAENGPEVAEAAFRWVPIADLTWLAFSDREYRENVRQDPIGYFDSKDLVIAEAEGVFSLLVYADDSRSLMCDASKPRKVVGAEDSRNPYGSPAVTVRLDGAGGERLEALTADFIGHQLAIAVGGEICFVAEIESTVSTAVNIGGNYTKAEAQNIRRRLLGYPMLSDEDGRESDE